MDEIDNAINEGRRMGESGENVWLPSAPQSSPSKTLPEDASLSSPPGAKTTSPSAPLEKESVAEQKVIVSRFTVTKTPISSPLSCPSDNTKNEAFHSPLTPEHHVEVVEDKEASPPSDATVSTTTTTTTITTTTSQATNTEEGQTTSGVAGTQTVDMEHQTSEKTAATTVALLREVAKELKTMLASPPTKEKGKLSPLVKLQQNKYCMFCLMVLVLLCLFGAFMWLLATLTTRDVPQQIDSHPNFIGTQRRVEQQIMHEAGPEDEEEPFLSPSKVLENVENEKVPAYAEEMPDSTLSTKGIDNEEEVEESTGGAKFETKATETIEDELIEEDTDDESLSIRPSNIEHKQSENIDSHTLDDTEITNAADIKPKILRVIYLKAHQCQQGGQVMLAEYVDMYRHLLNFFHIFGTFASVQGRMLETRLHSLEKYILSRDGRRYTTLASMIHFEDVTGRIGNVSPFSGTTLFTCLQRHLQFMSRALVNVLPLRPNHSLLHAFQAAYQDVLAIHHAWFVENFYLAGISMLPTKETAMQGVAAIQGGGNGDASPEVLHNSILAVIRALHQVIQTSEATLVHFNALQKVPKQVVT